MLDLEEFGAGDDVHPVFIDVEFLADDVSFEAYPLAWYLHLYQGAVLAVEVLDGMSGGGKVHRSHFEPEYFKFLGRNSPGSKN